MSDKWGLGLSEVSGLLVISGGGIMRGLYREFGLRHNLGRKTTDPVIGCWLSSSNCVELPKVAHADLGRFRV